MDHIVFERAEPDEVKITFKWFCSLCNESIEQVCLGQWIQYPSWPGEGWTKFPEGMYLKGLAYTKYGDGAWMCPRHKIINAVVITDDRKVEILE